MKIGEICTREVIITHRSDSALEAARLMREYHVGDVVVVDRDKDQNIPVGIVTDRDIVLELVAKEIDAKSVTSGDIMSTDLLIANEDDQLAEKIQEMRVKGVRRVPVVNNQGGLVGVVSEDDIVGILGEQLNDLVSLVKKGEKREQTMRV